jgi:site-specific DNA-methyltransferase (adenine-specific)
MLVDNKAHVPDILDCIANLSSDEVFTPPDVANQVLDLLPKEIWSNPDIKILDPCTKTGIFLRESARRLMIGLEKNIPDETKRREHIFKNMLFGIAITELTGLVARRSLYYSKDAKNDYSVVQFKDSDGNIQFKRMEHEYAQGKCKVCGSPFENLERGESMENYAYQFIHEEVAYDMKFDVVVGNPPYQIEDGGQGRSASPIYQLFVNQAFRLKPRYVAMIIPSRWFAGGKGLDEFRRQMLDSTNFRNLVDFPNAAELFPGVDISGGICYFLWDEKYEGTCEVKTYQSGEISSVSSRYLGEHGEVFVRFNQALPILEKVKKATKKFMDTQVSSSKPFGFRTFFNDFAQNKSAKNVEIMTKDGVFQINRSQLTVNVQWLDKYKVTVAKAYGERGSYPYLITSKPKILPPNMVCTETYQVCGVYETLEEAENFANYIRTRFFRFLVGLLKNTQDLSKSKFQFVPILDMTEQWNDEKLFKKFGITKDEQDFIFSLIREMPKVED